MSSFAVAACWYLILGLPTQLNALAYNQASQPVQVPAQASPTQITTPTASQPVPAPSPEPSQPKSDSNVSSPNAYDDIIVTAVGDVMLGTTFPDESTLPPNDGAGLLAEVTPLLKRGDVVYGNLEGPLTDGGDSAKCHGKKEGTCFAFRVPTRYNKYLKDAGFTVMGLANNHAMDFGQ
ncbi:MAG TPA: CapA family protein, partial [Candidatus Angelobacter sp.]|nr:CapA family protein [Candidatus Angelobacter sp.]